MLQILLTLIYKLSHTKNTTQGYIRKSLQNKNTPGSFYLTMIASKRHSFLFLYPEK